MSKSASFSQRAFSVVALFAGLHLFAIARAVGLAAFPILLADMTGFAIGKLILVCWVAAA